jgi:hypothetical protein
VLPFVPLIETWTQQARNRLSERPLLARQFLNADPGFTNADPLEQIPRASEVLANRLAALEQIIQELGGEG